MATYKYLDKIGLGQVWEKIKGQDSFLGSKISNYLIQEGEWYPVTDFIEYNGRLFDVIDNYDVIAFEYNYSGNYMFKVNRTEYRGIGNEDNLAFNPMGSYWVYWSSNLDPTQYPEGINPYYDFTDLRVCIKKSSADWNENNVNSPKYIENRTHWRENTSVTLVPQQTIEMEYDEETYAVYYGTANRDDPYDLSTGDEVTVNFGGTDYTCTVTNNEGYLGLSSITTSDYTVSITIGYSDCYIDVSYSDGQSAPESISVSIVSSGYTYHTLDERYLNGKLIKSGTGHLSNIFNDIDNNVASGIYSHAEGERTTASGINSHTEGRSTTASDNNSHAEGYYTTASAFASHAEGEHTTASGSRSHAEGYHTTASGILGSHAEGYYTTASGSYSHAEGSNTTAQRRSQHVFGEYNVLDITGSITTDKGSYIEIVGNGTSNNARSNARTLDWNGNEVLAGKLTIGTAPTNNMDVATKKYVDDATASITTDLVGLTDTNISSPSNGQFLQYNSTSSKWENKTYTAPVTSVNGQTGAVTISVPTASSTTPSSDGTGAVGVSTTYARADHVHPKITQTISISSNVITLTGSDGTTSSVTLPVYNGGVSSS